MRAFILLMYLTVTGCAITPVSEEQAGPRPTNAEATVRKYLAETLKDPDSLSQFEILRGPTPCKLGFKVNSGWCVTYAYNAKNSFGGYVGRTLHNMVIQNDEVILTDIYPIE